MTVWTKWVGQFTVALAGGSLWLAANAEPAALAIDPDAAVQVRFEKPDDFTDASFDNRKSTGAEVTQEIAAYLIERATPLLAPGQRLQIDVTDVDLAGRYEPWTSPGDDVRYLRDITWPNMRLSYRLLDARGVAVSEASERLSDMNYLMRAGLRSNSDRLRYEKSMIDDWLRARFGAKRPG